MKTDPIHILSLGAGVQSSCLALMAARGEVGPMPKAAIFADTHAEPKAVITWLDWLEKQLPFPVYRVSKGSLSAESLRIRQRIKTVGKPWSKSLIPAFVKNPDGSRGIMGRSCTSDFKIIPLLKKQREIAGNSMTAWRKENSAWQKLYRISSAMYLNPSCPARPLPPVVSWIGISLDEVSRMKPSRHKWAVNRWPLIEMEMTRHDCLRWMEKNGYPKPPRSACIYCPFHSDNEWRNLRDNDPEAFKEAAQFEKDLQAVKRVSDNMNGIPFLHDSLVPLDQVDFSDNDKTGQLKFHNECEGMCGV